MSLTLVTLAELCQAQIQEGHFALEINAAADIMSAKKGDITVLSSTKYAKYLGATQASVCLIGEKTKIENAPEGLIFLVCSDPEISFLEVVKALNPAAEFLHTISKKTDIAENVILGQNVHVGVFSSIGENTRIGKNSIISANVTVGANVTIGENCLIYSQVVLYDKTQLGDNVIINSGSIMGADGFGYKLRNNEHIKVPHVGYLIIEDNVEIGANTCIDKGVLATTKIGAGSKIDNLVQLGHNNQVGRNVIICGQSGISGSCTIEDGAILAGGVGIADHVTIGQQAIVMGRSGVSHNVEAGTQVFGTPARERRVAWKERAALSKLPELFKKIKVLEQQLKDLENK